MKLYFWKEKKVVPETSFISHFPGPRLLLSRKLFFFFFPIPATTLRPDITIMVDWALKINYLSATTTL